MRCKNQRICLIVLQPLGISLVAYKKGRNSFVQQKDDKKFVGRTGIKFLTTYDTHTRITRSDIYCITIYQSCYNIREFIMNSSFSVVWYDDGAQNVIPEACCNNWVALQSKSCLGNAEGTSIKIMKDPNVVVD